MDFMKFYQVAVCALTLVASPGFAQDVKCEKDYRNFEDWLQDVRAEALSDGISQGTWQRVLPQLRRDPAIIKRDGQQGGFYKTFIDYVLPRAHSRLERGRKLLRQNAELFRSIEKQYGVPGQIIVAFWGLETDFATQPSKSSYPVIRSMTTLAYDCRRAAFFRKNLMDALWMVETNEIAPENFVGEWAGEMGGLQFTPTNYRHYAVDFDRDGKADVIRSVPDLMASGANVLREYGWRRGEPFLQEVRVPKDLPWEQADLTLAVKHPVSYWSSVGVRDINGDALTGDQPAALMLPMGRLGPAFLAYPNFKALLTWNQSLNNALTAGYLANRIADPGLPAMSPGRGKVEVLSLEQMKELQRRLQQKGFDVGKIDGYMGTKTRVAVRKMQLKWGMPADAYPDLEFFKRLTGGGGL